MEVAATAVLNMVAKKNTVLPNSVSFMRLETSCISITSVRIYIHLWAIEANFHSNLHLQTQDMKEHVYILSPEKELLHERTENAKERDATSILIKPHPHPSDLKVHLLN